MLRAMIVDDEDITKQGLIEYYDWEKMGIEVVAEADDGEDALALVRQHQPQIILCDIKMPNMDGLTFAKRLHEEKNPAKIIFISGYDDIDYVKTALRVNAIDYILKPVNFAYLTEVLNHVIEELNQEYMASMQLANTAEYLRKLVVKSLLRGETLQPAGVEHYGRLAGTDAEHYLAVRITLHDYQAEYQTDKDVKCLFFAVENILQELLDVCFRCDILEDTGGFLCLAYLDKAQASDAGCVFETVCGRIETLLQIGLRVELGSLVNRFEDIRQSAGILGEAAQDEELEHVLEGELNIWETLDMALETCNQDEIRTVIDELFQSTFGGHRLQESFWLKICTRLLFNASNMALKQDCFGAEIRRTELQLLDEFSDPLKHHTAREMRDLVTSYYLKIAESLQQKLGESGDNVIGRIKTYIQENYGQPITIGEIASHVYLTENYICVLFKNKVGVTINNYLTKVRMERAKELLRHNEYKLYDICFMVGYSDASYFSKQFKKYTGVSPKEYRGKYI